MFMWPSRSRERAYEHARLAFLATAGLLTIGLALAFSSSPANPHDGAHTLTWSAVVQYSNGIVLAQALEPRSFADKASCEAFGDEHAEQRAASVLSGTDAISVVVGFECEPAGEPA